MGLDFSYHIYLKKENLRDAFKYISQNSDIATKAVVPKDKISAKFSCTLKFDIDDRITEYLIFSESEWYNPTDPYIGPISRYKSEDNKYEIGFIDVYVMPCHEGIEDLIEIKFIAVTNDMSLLFEESPSIDSFFKEFCRNVKADYGYLNKEHKGYKLICFDREICNLNVPDNINNPLHKYGFIKVMKDILK